VVGSDGRTLEVQIRTRDMHHRAELGLPRTGVTKRDKEADVAFESKLACSDLSWNGALTLRSKEFVDTLKMEILEDRVYVFTPRESVGPAGWLYSDRLCLHIHTDIGHRCRGAKVNGQLVPLTYTLKTAIRSRSSRRSRADQVVTGCDPIWGTWISPEPAEDARWFREQDRDENIAFGREQLRRELKRLNLTDDIRFQDIAALFEYRSLDDFFAAVGAAI